MLQAIVNGKAGRLPADLAPGDSWRGVFRGSEDLLTASVFERLAHIDGVRLWSILAATFGPDRLPAWKMVQLDEIEFWPLWNDAVDHLGQSVEPDVVLSFTVGDPPGRSS